MPILASPTPDPLPPSHGPIVADWLEANLQHGEGDLEGQPYRLAGHLLRATYRWFEYRPGATVYTHRKGVVGWAKGSAKTEWEAGLGIEHMEGPSWVDGTPVVTVAAVDGDQANELLRVADMMIPEDSWLRERLDYTEGGGGRPARMRQRPSVGKGRMLATSAALGKNDGKKTSLLLCDEVHEWDYHSDAGAKRHGILERNTNKRRGSRQLNVSTAGWSLESLLGAMYLYGCQVAAGEVIDEAFLFEWWESALTALETDDAQRGNALDLDDPAQLEAAIRDANPMAAELEWLIDTLTRSYREHKLRGKVFEFLRYHLNRWVDAQDGAAWIDDIRTWDARIQPGLVVPTRYGFAKRPPPPADTDVVLGFDGSESGDSTALIGATVSPTPYLFVVEMWERPERDPDGGWRVPRRQVEEKLITACVEWNVREIPSDVAYWRGSLERLREERGLPIEEFPQTSERMGPACERLYEAITRGQMAHDGDPRLRRHIGNARRHETEHGVRITKKNIRSRRWIDGSIAASMAHIRAQQLAVEQLTEVQPWVDFDD